jgi:hypothetical protein
MNNPNGDGRERVRQLMDEGKTFDEIVAVTGLSESTVENYQYAQRRPGETIRPNGRPKRRRVPYVRMVMRCQFTLEQSERLMAAAVRYGYHRPTLLIEQLVAVIVKDDLIAAVLDPDEVPHGDS